MCDMSKKGFILNHGKPSIDTKSTTRVNIVGVDHLIAAEKKEKGRRRRRYSTNTENYVRSSFNLLLLLLLLS